MATLPPAGTKNVSLSCRVVLVDKLKQVMSTRGPSKGQLVDVFRVAVVDAHNAIDISVWTKTLYPAFVAVKGLCVRLDGLLVKPQSLDALARFSITTNPFSLQGSENYTVLAKILDDTSFPASIPETLLRPEAVDTPPSRFMDISLATCCDNPLGTYCRRNGKRHVREQTCLSCGRVIIKDNPEPYCSEGGEQVLCASAEMLQNEHA